MPNLHLSYFHPLPNTVEALADTDIFPSTHPIIPHLVPARTALLENLSMFSEELMEQLLDLPSGPSAYLSVPSSAIMPHLRACTLRNDILPVLCGSAMKHVGTNLVLDYVGELLADPLSVSAIKNPQNGPVRMLAWKVTWDKRKGWMTFVRVYSGNVCSHSRHTAVLIAFQALSRSRVACSTRPVIRRRGWANCFFSMLRKPKRWTSFRSVPWASSWA
jgi:translation elongation factor EF-G